MTDTSGESLICPKCGTSLSPSSLSCFSCRQLIHAERLKALAAQAEQAANNQNISEALARWREALPLLPPDSRQYQTVSEKIAALSKQAVSPPDAQATGKKVGLGAAIIFLLAKLKFLLLGLGKASTFFSMLLFLAVYWNQWGWKFALGLVALIYIHEMGHVATLRRYGLPAAAPMFIPGFGALIRLNQHLTNPHEEARVGLSGPIWGLTAAILAYGVFWYTKWPSWAALARTGAWLTLFNLLPVWQLDGHRGFQALSRWQRFAAAGVIGLMWLLTREGLLIVLLLLALYHAVKKEISRPPDMWALTRYLALIIISSIICLAIPAPS